MKEYTTYQAILEEGEARGRVEGEARGRVEGKAEEARNLIIRLGSNRFGPPDASSLAVLEAITSLERLEQMADRLLEVENWNELLS